MRTQERNRWLMACWLGGLFIKLIFASAAAMTFPAAQHASLPLSPLHSELLILDNQVPDASWLQHQVRPGIDVVMLDTQHDPIQQLQTILASRHNLTALHLVTHGASGLLQLGTTRLDEIKLHQHPELVEALTAAIVPHGDLLLYGCDVAAGAAGQSFLNTLHQQTGLNVAASDNLTGASALGGDWVLEKQSGRRHVGLAFQSVALQTYAQLLVAAPSDESFDGITAPQNLYNDPSVTSTSTSTSINSSGWTFSASPSSKMGVVDSNTVTGSVVLTTPGLITGDQAFIFDTMGPAGNFAFASTDASDFYLNGVQLESIDSTVQVQAYQDGNAIGVPTSINLSSSGNSGIFTYTSSGTSSDGSHYGVLSITSPISHPVNKIEIHSNYGILLLDNIDITTVDITPPTVTSVNVPTNSTYTAGQNLDFTVNFSEAVTVNTSGGTPYLALTLGSSREGANKFLI